MMHKKTILALSITLVLLGSIGFVIYENPKILTQSALVKTKSTKSRASYVKISGLPQLKNDSEIIVEATVTNKQETRDYKGVPVSITSVEVKDVLKGTTDSKELKILQDAQADVTLKAGQTLLMFLKKGVDNPDCYVSIGGGQGIYQISKNKKNNELELSPQSLVNENIIKDLKGNYSDIKAKLNN